MTFRTKESPCSGISVPHVQAFVPFCVLLWLKKPSFVSSNFKALVKNSIWQIDYFPFEIHPLNLLHTVWNVNSPAGIGDKSRSIV